jgi:hypothetical protein
MPRLASRVRSGRFFELESEGEEGEDEIETDRDSFTPATTTAGDRRWIIESAYSFIDNRNVPETHSYPEQLARRGVGDWLEFLWDGTTKLEARGVPSQETCPAIWKKKVNSSTNHGCFTASKQL